MVAVLARVWLRCCQHLRRPFLADAVGRGPSVVAGLASLLHPGRWVAVLTAIRLRNKALKHC